MKKQTKQVQPKKHASKTKTAVKARRKKIIKSIIEGKTEKQAGIDAGLSPKTSEAQVCEILKEPEVRQTMTAMLEKAGITDEFLGKLHREQCYATKVISAIGGKEANGGTVDFVDVPDNTARINAMKLAYQIKGHLVEKTETKHSGNIGVTVQVIDKFEVK